MHQFSFKLKNGTLIAAGVFIASNYVLYSIQKNPPSPFISEYNEPNVFPCLILTFYRWRKLLVYCWNAATITKITVFFNNSTNSRNSSVNKLLVITWNRNVGNCLLICWWLFHWSKKEKTLQRNTTFKSTFREVIWVFEAELSLGKHQRVRLGVPLLIANIIY